MNRFLAVVSLLSWSVASIAIADEGRNEYLRNCASCHGEQGAGNGPSAQWLTPRPRDFTRGVFKCRSTPSDSLPTDADLEWTIDHGLSHTAMPGWVALSPRTKRELIAYVKSFSPRFASQGAGKVVPIPPRPPMTAQRVDEGRQIFERVECADCHGPAGRGDGSGAATAVDDWGYADRPADLTRPGLKCGVGPEAIVRDFLTGLAGSPMPSFAGNLSPSEAWSLAFYVWTLSHPQDAPQVGVIAESAGSAASKPPAGPAQGEPPAAAPKTPAPSAASPAGAAQPANP